MRVIVLLILAVALGCNRPKAADMSPDRTNGLARIVMNAKARGQHEVELFDKIEQASDSLDEAVQYTSLVVAQPGPSTVKVDPDHIITWQLFRVERWLRRRTPPTHLCSHSGPPEIPRRTDQIMIPLARGSAVVDGITVREMTWDQLRFDPAQRYLLFVAECQGDVDVLAYGGLGVFAIAGEDRIEGLSFSQPSANLVADVLEIGHLEALEAYLRVH